MKELFSILFEPTSEYGRCEFESFVYKKTGRISLSRLMIHNRMADEKRKVFPTILYFTGFLLFFFSLFALVGYISITNEYPDKDTAEKEFPLLVLSLLSFLIFLVLLLIYVLRYHYLVRHIPLYPLTESKKKVMQNNRAQLDVPSDALSIDILYCPYVIDKEEKRHLYNSGNSVQYYLVRNDIYKDDEYLYIANSSYSIRLERKAIQKIGKRKLTYFGYNQDTLPTKEEKKKYSLHIKPNNQIHSACVLYSCKQNEEEYEFSLPLYEEEKMDELLKE